MNNGITKFQKVQLILSIVPYGSTMFIAVVTMIELKRHNAHLVDWVKFLLIYVGGFATACLYSVFVMTGENLILNILVETLILFLANFLFIKLQNVCRIQHPESVAIHNKMSSIIVAVIAIAIFPIVFFLTIKISHALYLHSQYSIEDQNGEHNSSLAVISPDDVINESYTLTMLGYSLNTNGNPTGVEGALSKYDFDYSSFSASKISGVRIMQATEVPDDSLTLTICSSLEYGNMEIFIIIEGEVYANVNVNGTETIVLENIANKEITVRIGAESATASISVTREISE